MISIDVGYGNVKIYDGNALSAFPSVYYKCKPNETSPSNDADMIIKIDGDNYHVGMSALKLGGNAPFDKKDIFRHKVFVLTAICKTTEGDFDDDIALGLPIVDYPSMSGELTQLAGSYDVVFNGANRHINIKAVSVFKQSEAVYQFLRKQDQNIDSEVVGIVDIGQKTVDVAWFDESFYNDDRSGSFVNLGCLSAYTDIAKAVATELDIDVEPYAVRKYISKVPKASEAAFSFMAESIIERLKNRRWNFKELDKIVLIGGGADFISKYMPEQEKVTVIDGGVYANARSYYECEG